jgi:hypothetical protein
MTTPDFIIALFCAVDQEMRDVPKRSDAKLYPSEVVTLALLYAIKGGGGRAFYRWVTRDDRPLFPRCRIGPAWRGSARPTRRGRHVVWRPRPSWASPTATA